MCSFTILLAHKLCAYTYMKPAICLTSPGAGLLCQFILSKAQYRAFAQHYAYNDLTLIALHANYVMPLHTR